MKKYCILAVLVLSGSLMLKCGSKENSTAEQSGYVIAYNVLIDEETDNYEVFTMNIDGSEKRNITNLKGVEWTYYSYQDNLYFISDKDTCHRCYFLYQTNFKGEDPKKISEIQLADSWMSSRNKGTELIVRPKADSVFYIIDLKGNILQKIYTGLAYSTDPVFINGGSQIVFRGAYKKFKKDNGYKDELFVLNVDGTGLKQLTSYPEADTTAKWYSYHAGPPKLHPTENFLSYQSFQKGKSSLYAVTLDGSRNWKLTDNPQSEGWHEWSPDGKWLAIGLFDNDQSQFGIGLMNWETKEIKILTDTTYKYQQAPNFVKKNKNIE